MYDSFAYKHKTGNNYWNSNQNFALLGLPLAWIEEMCFNCRGPSKLILKNILVCIKMYIYFKCCFFYMCQSNFFFFTDTKIGKKKKERKQEVYTFPLNKRKGNPSVLKGEKMQTTQRWPSTQSKRNHFSECFLVWPQLSLSPCSPLGLDLIF